MLYRSTHPQPPPVALGVLRYEQYGLVAKQTHGCALAGVYNGLNLETTGRAHSNAAQRKQQSLQESACYTGHEASRVTGGGADEIRVGD